MVLQIDEDASRRKQSSEEGLSPTMFLSTTVCLSSQAIQVTFDKELVLEHGEHGSWDYAPEDAAACAPKGLVISFTTITVVFS